MGAGQGRGRPGAPRRGPLQPGRGAAGDDPAARPLPAADERDAAHRAGRGVAASWPSWARAPVARRSSASRRSSRRSRRRPDDRLPHPSLPLRAAGGRASSRRRCEAGVERMLNVGLGDETNEVAIAAAERHEAVFATVGCHPTSAGGFDDARPRRSPALAAHEKVRAIGETGIDYYRETASPADQRRAFEAQIEIAREHGLPIVIHARDPEGETDGDRRGLRDPRRAGRRPPGDPALLPRPLAGRGRDRARLVLLLLGDRHLPQGRGAARGGREAARRAGPGRDRRALPRSRSRCAASRTSRPTSSPPPRSSPRCAASPTRSWSGRSRRTRGPSSAGSRVVQARAELPRRPQPARRDRPRRRARARRRRARGRRRGRGADRAAGARSPAAHVHAVEIDRGLEAALAPLAALAERHACTGATR